jgi:hypothetical protein
MTLQDFFQTTAGVPAPDLRRAMVRALAAEPARTPDALARFYRRVAEQIDVAAVVCRRAPTAPAGRKIVAGARACAGDAQGVPLAQSGAPSSE